MRDRANLILQRRLLLGALVCIVLLLIGYLVFVNTSMGHQLDDAAFFGRNALKRRMINLDSNILDLVSKAGLLLAGAILIIIAAVRRCLFVGVIALLGFGCAVVGAEVLKRSLPWRLMVPDDALIASRPSGWLIPQRTCDHWHLVCLKPDFGFIGSVASLVRCRCSLLELNVCHSGSVCRLASAVRRSGGPGLVGALHELGRKPGSSTPWPTESPDRAPGARRSEQRGIGDSCHGSHLADCQGSCIRISTR